MSSATAAPMGPAPVDASPEGAATPISPYAQTTTATIERANRLAAVRVHPGFLDLVRLSEEIRNEATAQLLDFGGWDKDQIALLKARAQAAKELHSELFFRRLTIAIQAGVDEARALNTEAQAAQVADFAEHGDYVRKRVLDKFETLDPARIPGSY